MKLRELHPPGSPWSTCPARRWRPGHLIRNRRPGRRRFHHRVRSRQPVAVQVDGKLVASGGAASSPSSFAAVRFNADGSARYLIRHRRQGHDRLSRLHGAGAADRAFAAGRRGGPGRVSAGAVVTGKGKNQVTNDYND